MTRSITTSILALAAAAVLAAPSFAAPLTPSGRQVNQQKRIAQGVRSGELTRKETRRLETNAARVHRSIKRDRIDGGAFTRAERAEAQRKLNRQSRAIAVQKRDGQSR